MTDRTDLEKLSNQEIRELWKQTTDRARKLQAERQQNTAAQTASEEGFYRDAFGNMIEGVAPKRKENRYYVDSSGWVVELSEGQEAPRTSGNSLVDWLNTVDVSHDPEVREALGKENLFFEERFSLGDSEDEIVVTGKLETRGWTIDTQSENEKLNLSFRLSRSLTREQAIQQAVSYVESKAGPQFKNLTDADLRIAERMAAAPNGQFQALVFYVAARLPDELSEESLRIGASGDDMEIFKFASDEGVSEIIQEAIACVFHWTHVGADEKFFDYVRANDDGKIWNFGLLSNLWTRYQVASTVEKLDAQDAPTAEDLDQLSDEEIEKTLAEARRLRARTQAR